MTGKAGVEVILGAPFVAPASGAEVLPAIIPATRRGWPLGVLGAALEVAAGLVCCPPWTEALTPARIATFALAPTTRVMAVNGRVAGVDLVDLRPSVAGVLTEVLVIEGPVIEGPAIEGQMVARGAVLMTIADLDRLVVETDVDDSHALRVKAGQLANLQLTGETGLRPAHARFVAGQVDASTGGLVVKITPDDPIRAPIGLPVTAKITRPDR